ncbi:recombinase family protein [Nostoc sp. NIES-2111]
MSVYACYMRVSTDDQRDKKTILQQREQLHRHAKQHGITFAKEYIDEGESGSKPFEDRPGAAALIADAQAKAFDTLLLCDWDRLSRDLNIGSTILHMLEKSLRVKVESITQPMEKSDEGRFMRNLQLVFAEYERMKIRSRTMRGAYHEAPKEARYLGGPRPFGYRIEGLKREAKYVLNELPIPGIQLSEAEIMREIYKRAASRESCVKIAGWLEGLKVPTVYLSDGKPLKATRAAHSSAIWRPSRVRNMIVNPMYKGQHTYGKKGEKPVVRAVPAIVTPELWQQAQAALKANCMFSSRNAKNNYLLRGLMKCNDAKCGLTFIGTVANRRSGKHEFYYICNGKHCARGLYGLEYKRCPSKAVNGTRAEDLVWSEIEGFLRNPGEVLKQLEARQKANGEDSKQSLRRLAKLEAELRIKDDARRKIILREAEGIIDLQTMREMLKQLDKQADSIRENIQALKEEERDASENREQLRSVEGLLSDIRARLDGPLPFVLKRAIVELLVHSIKVETTKFRGKNASKLHVCYKFDAPIATLTRKGSSPPAA